MRSATLLSMKKPRPARKKDVEPTVGAHADYRRTDFEFQREQQRGTSLAVKSPPPFKPSIVRNLFGAAVASFEEYVNRPYRRHRAF